jgi:hypothetical protein
VALAHVLLFFHLLGAVSFFAGGAVVGTLQLAAIRRERPSEVYALLRLAPVGAAPVGAGALLTLVFGVALTEHEGFGLSPAWIQAEGDVPSAELHDLVAAPVPLFASLASGLMLMAILALMAWQPT